MPQHKNRDKRDQKSAFPDRETIAKAEGRLAKADKQRARIKANPKKAVTREQQRVKRAEKDKTSA
jgi:hypothetical protein